MENDIDKHARKWVAVLHEQAKQNPQVDWELWARYFSFDVITALSFGESLGFLDAKSDVRGLIGNMDKAMYLQKISLYPPIAWFARKTFLGRLAGPDSISLMTTNLMFLMAAHPHLLKRAQLEIDKAIQTQQLSAQSPKYNDCRRLPFVDACPERWLQASEAQLRTWETLDVHWGFGVRKCLGKHIGSMVLYKSTVLLLHHFDFQLKENTRISLWSHPSSTMIRIVPRMDREMSLLHY
ncbi:MAG: hypothetical protein LQ345_002351 [Seirophora villosa]|nr:MAG: hypothetical protein LQ345_002351 [Seirophora villosa]